MKKLNLLKSLGIASMFLFALVLAAPNYGYAATCKVTSDCTVKGEVCNNYLPAQTINGVAVAEVLGTCGVGSGAGVTLQGDNTRQVGVLVSTELNQSQDLIGTISTVINWFLGFVGIIVFGIFLLAGFEYATAGGDAGKTETAQKRMTNAVIGMVILFFAFTASNTILTFVFGGVETGAF